MYAEITRVCTKINKNSQISRFMNLAKVYIHKNLIQVRTGFPEFATFYYLPDLVRTLITFLLDNLGGLVKRRKICLT